MLNDSYVLLLELDKESPHVFGCIRLIPHPYSHSYSNVHTVATSTSDDCDDFEEGWIRLRNLSRSKRINGLSAKNKRRSSGISISDIISATTDVSGGGGGDGGGGGGGNSSGDNSGLQQSLQSHSSSASLNQTLQRSDSSWSIDLEDISAPSQSCRKQFMKHHASKDSNTQSLLTVTENRVKDDVYNNMKPNSDSGNNGGGDSIMSGGSSGSDNDNSNGNINGDSSIISSSNNNNDVSTSDVNSDMKDMKEYIAERGIRLAEGHYGTCYLAQCRGTNVVVKVFKQNVHLGAEENFASEVSILIGIRHPNTILFMGACIDPPERFIVLSLIHI